RGGSSGWRSGAASPRRPSGPRCCRPRRRRGLRSAQPVQREPRRAAHRPVAGLELAVGRHATTRGCVHLRWSGLLDLDRPGPTRIARGPVAYIDEPVVVPGRRPLQSAAMETLRRLARHNDWSNRIVFEAVRRTDAALLGAEAKGTRDTIEGTLKHLVSV